MSLSPSSSHGAPTLAEVLLQRTFARPPQPFADGELLQALTHPAKDAAPSPDAAARSKPSGSSSSDSRPGSGSAPGDDASASSSDGGAPGRTVDVRV
jgi:hypothetical protein